MIFRDDVRLRHLHWIDEAVFLDIQSLYIISIENLIDGRERLNQCKFVKRGGKAEMEKLWIDRIVAGAPISCSVWGTHMHAGHGSRDAQDGRDHDVWGDQMADSCWILNSRLRNLCQCSFLPCHKINSTLSILVTCTSEALTRFKSFRIWNCAVNQALDFLTGRDWGGSEAISIWQASLVVHYSAYYLQRISVPDRVAWLKGWPWRLLAFAVFALISETFHFFHDYIGTASYPVRIYTVCIHVCYSNPFNPSGVRRNQLTNHMKKIVEFTVDWIKTNVRAIARNTCPINIVLHVACGSGFLP